MLTSQALREYIHDAREEIRATVDLATEQERELTATEQKLVDDHLDSIDQWESQLEKREKLDNELKARGAIELGKKIGMQNARSAMQQDAHGNAFVMASAGESIASKLGHEYRPGLLGHLLCAKALGANRSTPEFIKAAMSEGTNSAGGFLVDNPLITSGFQDLARAKMVLNEAGSQTIAMDSETLTIPQLLADATPYVVGENTTITASDLTFGSTTLQTYKIAMLVKISREMYEDAGELVARQIENALASKMAERVDYYGLTGTGSSQPLGLLNQPTLTSTASAGEWNWDEAAELITGIRLRNHEPNACILHPTIWSDLWLTTTGDASTSAALWQGSPPNVVDGVKFLHTANMSITKALCGDFTNYVIGLRNGIQVDVSTEAGTAFADHQIWLKTFVRVAYGALDLRAFEATDSITT